MKPKRVELYRFFVSHEEFAAIRKLADLLGMTDADFVRQSLLLHLDVLKARGKLRPTELPDGLFLSRTDYNNFHRKREK